MPRKPSGTVRHNPARGCYQTRLRFKDGQRIWVDLPKGLSKEQAEARSRRMAKEAKTLDAPAPKLRALAQLRGAGGETVDAYFDRLCADRRRRGVLTVYDDECRYKAHVKPVIGTLPIAHITRDEVERLRDELDTKATAGSYVTSGGRKLSFKWKSAANVWTVVTTIFSAAQSSKQKSLRVRSDNPTADVQPTDRGKRKSKQFLYPSEVMVLLSCDRVPTHWRRAYALSTYLYLRAGELEVLTWGDVDIEHRLVSINKAMQADGTIGPPKNGEPRRVPIEDALVPLLSAMRREAFDHARASSRRSNPDEIVGETLVVPMPQRNNRAAILRADLRRCSVTRWDLFARDATRTPITFHDLRATGITWRAVRGDPPFDVRTDAGHKSVATTEIYVRMASALKRGFGEVFPLTPAALDYAGLVTRSVTNGGTE